TLSQMGHVLAIRSDRDSLLAIGVFSNRMLVWAVSLTFVLQLAIIYVPVLNAIFNTTPLTALELLACLAISSVVFVAVETEKWLRRRAERRSHSSEL
ncbi:MAG: cation transporting ATPase C-terminal domain-containing protein, partial [Hyphomicrobiaceae bacterium]|nr:cation transporting ATPase C-terminal domain-containing protein [Hyphomicrobiaceae bacterium]